VKPLQVFVAAGSLALLACAQVAQAATIMVTKTATCPCCEDWVAHMKKAGFTVQVRNVADLTPIARKLGVPDKLRSCHTSQVGGYVIEGHVPAADVKRLLKLRPKAEGLAVPGMVAGSPGMDRESMRMAYKVVLFEKNGKSSVFASH